MLSIFKNFIWFSIFGLIFSALIGYYYSGTYSGALQGLFLAAVLGLLEISISFDNAIVNATVLKNMTPAWRHLFLTWGIIIAVFGMRLVFPLVIVSVAASVNPIEALKLALFNPDEYSRVMLSVQHQVAAFGGSFLLLVAFQYFFNTEKSVHWIRVIEKPLSKLGRLEAIEVGITLLVIFSMSRMIPENETLSFLYSGLAGVITYLLVDGIGTFLRAPNVNKKSSGKALINAALGSFIYLEVLDASFSFDGVVGAFAISNNLFLIAIGLGIGAMFVRSMTIYLVERGTLSDFKFLEHGAFYAVWALAAIMFINTVTHIPEIITGFIGALFIGLSILSSVREAK